MSESFKKRYTTGVKQLKCIGTKQSVYLIKMLNNQSRIAKIRLSLMLLSDKKIRIDQKERANINNSTKALDYLELKTRRA